MSSQPFRLPSGGAIDRSRTLEFRFDGRQYPGHPGDTLASALLASGVHLVGRSFKYHRPRGILTAGSEEPSALVELREGARREPNTRATLVELFDGLTAYSQNRYPSLAFDVLAVNQLFSRFLTAGFYYKTFMWPSSFWESVYERMIRRSAGLGRAATAADPDHYEHGHAHADVVVVGAGPAGLMAALAAGRSGARVILLEELPWPGGRLALDREQVGGRPAGEWVQAAVDELAGMDNVTVMLRTAAVGYYDHNVLAALERVSDHLPEPLPGHPRQRLWTLRAGRVVLATGSIERPMVFAGNDRPGVMLSSAARTWVNRFAVAPGRRVVVATNNDDAYATALDLHAAGVPVAGVLDARDEPGSVAEAVRAAGIRVVTGALPRRALGGRRVRGLEIQSRDGRVLETIACDCLAVSAGHNPHLSMASQTGGAPRWDERLAAFVPGPALQGERSAGACNGEFELAAALAAGARAGRDAAEELGFAGELPALPQAESRQVSPIAPVWRCPGPGKAFVDFQNDVTADDIELAYREGYVSVEHTKRYTTLGMGTDQGRVANVNGLALLAAARGEPIPRVGTTRYRPPSVPVAIAAYAGHERGRDFQPIRRTAVHRWHERAGAVFVEAGLWLRPRYYPHPGEDMMTAIGREAAAVRASVGLCDVSTLGKVDIYGPDAGALLDRLYINHWSTLPVGKARYGLMLREDGHVFDDGTTSRLAEDHYFMTCTTANAARVVSHLDYCTQVLWPELDVAYCSATEQWCGIAVAGPRSRELLGRVFPDRDLSNDALPFMGVLQFEHEGVPVRIFRISFSGELAYEVNVPWGNGEAMWTALFETGRPLDVVPYGTEALSVLRIEKGHVAGPELDGRTTAADLGMGRMMSKKKAFVGLVMAGRAGMADPARPRLVGVRPLNPGQRLRAGAHVVEDPATATAENSLGWVSSVAESPAMGHWIGLALVRGGADRIGSTLVAHDPLRGESVPVQVCEPCFVDPEGERLRA